MDIVSSKKGWQLYTSVLIKIKILCCHYRRMAAAFVLVHGTGHGGWCWRFIAPLLRAAGHDVMITHPNELAEILLRIANKN
jgi:hypothetical protein